MHCRISIDNFYFAGSDQPGAGRREEDKLGGEWLNLRDGGNHFECETYSQVEGGDHTILIGLVRRASRFEGEPLLFAQGQCSVADSHPEVWPSPEVGGAKPETSSEGTIISQIFEAHQLISSTFDEHRRIEGIDISVARALVRLYDTSGLKTDQVARATHISGSATRKTPWPRFSSARCSSARWTGS